MPDSARIFISYSRKDGAAFAAHLRKKLLKKDLSVWQDITALEGGLDWWSQIEDVVRSKALQHFVFIVTPTALASPVVRQEIRLARQEGKTVSPIKGPGLGELGKLPRWLGQTYDLELAEHFTTLVRVLQAQSRQKRVPMMAPEPPADFVQRHIEFDALKKTLLDAKGDAVAITAALKGAGGYGKTTLAKALAHDPDIQDAYFDGVLWVQLGERPDNLLGIVTDLVTLLTGTPPGLETINAAAAALGEALGDRRILMILDDAWREQDLRPFLQGGRNTTRLITTRIDYLLPANAVRQPVGAMRDDEALKVLSSGLPPDQVRAQIDSLRKLAARLLKWMMLLKLVNGFLRDRVIKSNQSLAAAVVGVNRRLDEKGLVAFDAHMQIDRTNAITRTIGVSLELLDELARVRFGELGVFPEDADIPIGIVGRLWAETGHLGETDTEDLLSELYGLSLLLSLDLDRRAFRLHDTIRHFLRDEAGKEGLVTQNKRLLRSLDGVAAASEADNLTRRYFYLNLPYHLAEAMERERLDELLLNPGWLKAKLAATANAYLLAADYNQYGAGEAQTLIGRTLRLTAGICARDQHQLIPQLLGRLMHRQGDMFAAFLDAARSNLSLPAILEQCLSLTPPGAEFARLEGHSQSVTALCVLPEGRLASGSSDDMIGVWDIKTGIQTAFFAAHPNSYWGGALCALPDGRVASGSLDGTIRLWDDKAGLEFVPLRGHMDRVRALCALPGGRLASGSDDKTIRIWDLSSGTETACLEGHLNSVIALCVLPDGRLASGSRDHTIRLWDLKANAETASLEGHRNWISVLCMAPNGRLASGSHDRTVKLWDLADGTVTRCLRGHLGPLVALCMLTDGRLASGARDDNTIRLWDVKSGDQTAALDGHLSWIAALCSLPDGRLASGSNDNTIRLWDVSFAGPNARVKASRSRVDLLQQSISSIGTLCVLPDGQQLAANFYGDKIRLWDINSRAEIGYLPEGAGVGGFCVLPDGQLASGSSDGIVLWNPKTGTETARLRVRHPNSDIDRAVRTLCALPDGRLASGSIDGLIRLWDPKSGSEHALLNSSGFMQALWPLPDGRLLSCHDSDTIRLWDLTTGAETHVGHSNPVLALCVLPNGRLASGSRDGTIWLWGLDPGAETACLEGHGGAVTALCMLPDGRLASGSNDKTIRLWDIVTRCELARLELDAPVTCIVALPHARLVAGDQRRVLHWLEIID